ncbi:helix-turn-helix transcriptional regulator [Actinomadura decatromicini]|uniref:AAA family ATPase n=1 Tax=Actinomadura decatromicini TaxID=2604572 RepID=A0A5D3FWJ4_9ACTN|nr:helix-turn-helix transcriptional regulator [Actinomadura decatromicini]TYK52432.1 AAA family ATPase [Actinomadura decatromicini]
MTGSAVPESLLLGRQAECAAIEALLDAARDGHGSVLVVRGEAGMGKTALMEYGAARASAFRVVRVAGVESESELMGAGLQRLLGPSLSEEARRLPGPQSAALGTALGLRDGPAADRFLVGLAVLGLLSRLADQRPLLVVVDDAQWLDSVSMQVLAFVARRLAAERMAMLFSLREPGVDTGLDGLPALVLAGLGVHDARRLLGSVIPGGLDEQVRDRIVAETQGNPLALLELPRTMTPAELAGGFGLPDARMLSGRIEHSFVRRVESLPADTRLLLFTAAAEPVGDMLLLMRALEHLGIALDAAAPAEAAGLIDLGPRMVFRHPLVRTAAYRAAPPEVRRRGHAALAEGTDPEADPDRRAWHRAHATAAPDEDVAAELEHRAARAQARAGAEAAAAFLERAAELTPDPRRRGVRALAAARAKLDAGAPGEAEALLALAAIAPLEVADRALLERVRAHTAFARTRGSDTPTLLSVAATRLEPVDPDLARETHLEAMWALMRSGRFGTADGVLTAAKAALAPLGGHPVRAVDQFLEVLVTRRTQPHGQVLPAVARALETFQREGLRRDNIAWCWLACQLAMDVWDDAACAAMAGGLAEAARERGMLTVLPFALNYSAAHHLFAGRFDLAQQLIQEADSITRATRNVAVADFSILLAAWRGERDRTLEMRERVLADATARGEGFAVEAAEWAAATLHLGYGEYGAAADAAQRAYEPEGIGFTVWVLPELIEAAVRSGDRATAQQAFERLAERSATSQAPWARGIEARSRALLSEGGKAEELYRDSIEHLARSRVTVHQARAQLIYGEWLRRHNRRVDARVQLKAAHHALDAMGADAFARRAERELLATGETVHKRTDDPAARLTPQEAQIAGLARDGQTNPEIAARLFLSHRTVEWHLRKVFTKLDIASRKELARALRATEPATDQPLGRSHPTA